MWVLIFGDMAMFAFVFADYLADRANDADVYRRAQATLDRNLGALNTLLLLTSSLLVAQAVRRMRAGARGAALMIGGALVCALGFVGVKVVEYHDKLHAGLRPSTNGFFTFYYVLTGLHLFHVVLGIGVLLFLVVQARRPVLAGQRLAWVEGGACFWHMVDLLWIMLFPLLYLVR